MVVYVNTILQIPKLPIFTLDGCLNRSQWLYGLFYFKYFTQGKAITATYPAT